MTDLHKVFMVKINNMIKKKTGASFLVVYIIYGSLVYTDSKKTVLFTPPAAGFIPFVHFLKVVKMQTCMHTGRFMYVSLCS